MAKKNYTEEQKAEILKRAAETSIANAAKEFNVSAVTISRWKAADKVTAVEIEAKKKTRAAGRKAKETIEKPVKKTAAKAKTVQMELIVQSPAGAEINTVDLAAKLPKGAEKVYIRVDQNKLYWVGKDGATGDVDIW